MAKKGSAEAMVRDIKRKTRRQHNTEEKIRIVLEGLRGEETIAALRGRHVVPTIGSEAAPTRVPQRKHRPKSVL